MRVLKFGGSALRDGAAVRHAAGIVRAWGGAHPLVVVSAHEGVTERLEASFARALEGDLAWDPVRVRHRTLLRELELPEELLGRLLRELRGTLAWTVLRRERGDVDPLDERRMRDFVLSFGERLSARVFAAVLRREGVEATPVDAHDLGLLSGRAGLGPPEEAREWLVDLLERVPGVPVVTGFFALDESGHLATLGRNGSDLTAAWLGAAVRADEVQLWKRVPGILSADPTLVHAARPLGRLGWDDAEGLARHGSGVLHPETIGPVRRASVALCVRDLDRPEAPGTRIEGEGTGDVAVAHRAGLVRLRVQLEDERARRLSHLFEVLAEEDVEPHLASVRASFADVLVSEGHSLHRALKRLEGLADERRDLATIALIGAGSRARGSPPGSPGSRERDERDERLRRTIERALAGGADEFPADDASDASGSERPFVFVVPRERLVELVPALHESFVEVARPDGGDGGAGASGILPRSTG